MSKFLELDIQRFATSVDPLDEPFIVEGDPRYNWDEEKDCARSIEYQVHSLNGETISSVYDSRGNDVSASWGVPGTWLIKVFTYPYQNRLTFVSESGSTYSLDIIIEDEFEKTQKTVEINKDLKISDSDCRLSDVSYYISHFLDIIHPIGSIVKTTSSTCPFSKGEWVLKTSAPDRFEIGSQVIYTGTSGSGAVSKTSVYGAYDYRLINVFMNAEKPNNYHKEYKLTFQGTTGSGNVIYCYINNIKSSGVGTYSGTTFREIGRTNFFKESDIVLETTKGYSEKGTNLHYEVTGTGSWTFTDVTIHGYYVSDDTYYYWERVS